MAASFFGLLASSPFARFALSVLIALLIGEVDGCRRCHNRLQAASTIHRPTVIPRKPDRPHPLRPWLDMTSEAKDKLWAAWSPVTKLIVDAAERAKGLPLPVDNTPQPTVAPARDTRPAVPEAPAMLWQPDYDTAKRAADGGDGSPRRPFLIFFTASWCNPCKDIKPTVEQLLKARPNVSAVVVDIDKHDELAKVMGIRTVPQVLYYDELGKGVRLAGLTTIKVWAAKESK